MTLEKIIELIQAGQPVVLPTETVYGLFAQAFDEKAVARVYQLKQRPREKALNLNVASFDDILTYSRSQPDYLTKLYQAFLPGPLTIILQSNERVPAWINSGLATVGFRLPNHPLTREIIQRTGPLIGPSANVSGQASGKIFAEIKCDFAGQIKGVADDQAILGVDSTILDLSKPKARILRQGSITKEELLVQVPELIFKED